MSLSGDNSAQKSIPLIIAFLKREISTVKKSKTARIFFLSIETFCRASLRLNDFLMLGGCDVNSKIIQFEKNNSVILKEEEGMMSMNRRSDNNQTN